MQIFILDIDMSLNASFYMDKHIVKIPTELAQILCTSLHQNGKGNSKLYKSTHPHHPWIHWAHKQDNFNYLIELGKALCNEYTFRYKRHHKALDMILFCESINFSSSTNLSQFPLCMPTCYHSSDPIESYRNYYINEKKHLAKWTLRSKPYWWPL